MAAVSGVRLPEQGSLIKHEAGYTLHWSGKAKEDRRLSAVGLMINNSIDKKHTSFPVGHSDWLMFLHLPLLGNQFMTIVSVYAPTLQADPVTKEKFYRELKSLHLKVDKADKLLIMGDVNARVGRDHLSANRIILPFCSCLLIGRNWNEKHLNSDVRAALSARTSAFKSGNFDDRKQASYDLRKSIKAAKRQYKNKVEEQFNTNNVRSMWQGINNITDFKGNKPATVNIAASLPDKLNLFYARFEAHNTAAVAEEASTISISVADVTRSFRWVNMHKAVGPDGIPGRVLRPYAFQLAGVFTDIFNISLSLSVVPLCFKKSTIVPIPKKNKITCLNDWRPIALTPIFSKCFEKLIRDHICSVLPASLDPLQFAYRSNRSTDDAIAFTLHTALSHLENKNAYVRMLFVDYSSAFNTIVPATLVAKLQTLGLNRSLCSWILDFLTGRSQVVRMGNNTSSPLTLNTGASQGCVLSPLLYSLYTHDCAATHSSNVIVKFADDTTVIGLITDNDETAYRAEVSTLTKWCQENHLSLNINKTKELVVDFRRQSREHTPITIDKTPVERVNSFKFLDVHITEDLTWSAHTDAVLKKTHQCLFFLRWLRKFGMSPSILRTFYTCTVESILTSCITAWFGNSTAGNRKALQRVVRTARHIVGSELPSLQDQAVYKESLEDHQWLQPPVPQTVLSAALRKTSPQHPIPH